MASRGSLRGKFLAERSGQYRMAKRPKRRFNLRKVRVAGNVTISNLAAFALVKGTIIPASTNPYRIVSSELAFQVVDLGAVIDDGHEVGLAHGDYTASEIEECIEAATSIDIGDKIAQEQANRLVRTIGFAKGAGPVVDGSLAVNLGRPVKTKLNWKIGIGDTFDAWVRNGSDTVWSTGSTLSIIGHVWVRDGI